MKKYNKPLVSIIVPSYNHAKYITKTIESLVNQTYSNIELIVIDDGSKDNSVQIIQKLVDKHHFIFIHRDNKGVSATLNEGIQLATGKYITFCASDDIYLTDKIEKQVEFMETNLQYEMCYGKVIHFDDIGNMKKSKIRKPKSGWIFNDLFKGNFIPAPTIFIKKNLFNEVGYFDETIPIEDWDLLLRITYKYQIGYLDEYLAYYRIHSSNTSSNIDKMIFSEKQIMMKWKEHPLFSKMYQQRQLIWFSKLSINQKKMAMDYLPLAITNLNNITALKGLIQLILPTKIIKYIKKIKI